MATLTITIIVIIIIAVEEEDYNNKIAHTPDTFVGDVRKMQRKSARRSGPIDSIQANEMNWRFRISSESNREGTTAGGEYRASTEFNWVMVVCCMYVLCRSPSRDYFGESSWRGASELE